MQRKQSMIRPNTRNNNKKNVKAPHFKSISFSLLVLITVKDKHLLNPLSARHVLEGYTAWSWVEGASIVAITQMKRPDFRDVNLPRLYS